MKISSDRYWRALNKDEKGDLAKRLLVTRAYLSNVMNMTYQCSKSLAVRIDDETDGNVSKEQIRADVNWSEL